MLKSFKYELRPNNEQKEKINQFLGSVRFVYNLALETKIMAWTSGRNLSCFDLNNQLPELRREVKWLQEVPAQSLQQAITNLDTAYTNFFKKRADFPRFKSKKGKQSMRFPQDIRVDFEKWQVFIPKLKWLSFNLDRKFNGSIRNATLSSTPSGKYFISILVETGEKVPIKKPVKESTTIGVDFGIKDLLILSDGTKISNPKFLREMQKQLRIGQRKLDRRCKKEVNGKKSKEQSKGYEKQKLVVAKLYERISNKRKDFLDKVSTSIVKKYDTICLEDLNVAGMVRNHKLALAIQDASWSELKRMFEYKAEWYGKNILFIGRFEPSSKLCSCCGHINHELKLSDRTWECSVCKTEHDRDVNAANNIKTLGLRTQSPLANVKPLTGAHKKVSLKVCALGGKHNYL